MAGTKIKPQRISTNNSPQVGYVPKYVDEQTFEWGAGSGATDIGNNYLILTGTMAGTPPEVDIADTRITDTTPYVIFYETQPVGNITRTLTNGNLHIASDNNADTLDVKVVFMGIGPARNYMKGVFTFTGTTHQILDPRITASSAVVAMPRPTPVGYITGSTDVGEINFASTGVEIGVLVDYVVFNDGVAFSDGMAYNATLSDDDIMFRKNSATGVDEAFKVSDLKGNIESFIQPIIGSKIPGNTFTVFNYPGNNAIGASGNRQVILTKTCEIAGQYRFTANSRFSVQSRLLKNGVVVATSYSTAGFVYDDTSANIGDIYVFENNDGNESGEYDCSLSISFTLDYSSSFS